MKRAMQLTALIAITLAISTTALATQGVSPGAANRMAVVNNACPTFSWVESEDAEEYEIVAYALPENPAEPLELTPETEVLYAAVPAGATSWSPSAEQCVAHGGRYVWFVRAVTELAGDDVIEAGEWSKGRYFTVPAGPSDEEVARAVEVLKRWEAASGGGSLTLSSGTGTGHRKGEGVGVGHRKSVPTASAAIRGTNPEVDLEAYGVVGTTDSVYGAGVAAANTEGGPDLVLDGSFDGATDTVLSEWGISRTSASDERFQIVNTGGGAMTLDVHGTVSSSDFDCPGCIEPTDLADESVTSAAIEDDGVTEVDIAPGAVNSTHIFDGSVQAQDLAVDAVNGAAIADGSITPVDLANGAVIAAKIADGAVFADKIADGAVNTDKIADRAVGSAQIALNAISETELADEAVTNAKISPGAVGGLALADGSVDGNHLRNNTVSSAKIVDGAINAADLASASVGSDEIENGSIQGDDIDASVIGTGHLAPDAVTSDRIAPGAVETADLHEGSVNTLKIADGTIIEADLANGAVTSAKISDGAITAADVDPSGGIYASKTAVYDEDDIDSLYPGTCVVLTATCRDGNDLPLQGVCGLAPYSPTYVMGTTFEYWNDPEEAATWECQICQDTSGSSQQPVSATILCISVPGP